MNKISRLLQSLAKKLSNVASGKISKVLLDCAGLIARGKTEKAKIKLEKVILFLNTSPVGRGIKSSSIVSAMTVALLAIRKYGAKVRAREEAAREEFERLQNMDYEKERRKQVLRNRIENHRWLVSSMKQAKEILRTFPKRDIVGDYVKSSKRFLEILKSDLAFLSKRNEISANKAEEVKSFIRYALPRLSQQVKYVGENKGRMRNAVHAALCRMIQSNTNKANNIAEEILHQLKTKSIV